MDSDDAMDAKVWRQLGAGEFGMANRWRQIRDSSQTLGQIEKLRASWGPEMARFASLQDELSRRARKRFPEGRPLFWTSKGLEQATPAAVSAYRAGRFASCLPAESLVWDACCGVGADTVAILRALEGGSHRAMVLGTDWDAASARCAAANLQAAGEELRASRGNARTAAGHLVARCDLRSPPLTPAALAEALVLLDPDRRPDGQHREPRPERWAPPISDTLELARSARGACVKLPPSLDAGAEGLDRDLGSPWQLEWISLDGEMKELAFWTGTLALGGNPAGRRLATALRTAKTGGPAPPAMHYGSDVPPGALPEAWPLDRLGPGNWLVELDPSLWQADLAGRFCEDHGLAPIVTEIRGMFLVAANPPDSPLARCWPILECMSADRKRVRKALRNHSIGPVTVKKRNHPKSSMELEAAYQGPGAQNGLLAVFRVPGRSAAVLLGPAKARGPSV